MKRKDTIIIVSFSATLTGLSISSLDEFVRLKLIVERRLTESERRKSFFEILFSE